MTTGRRLALGGALVLVLASVAFVLYARSGPARTIVDVGAVARQATFRSTVTASGEIVAVRYADIGSDVMGKIVKLAVAEGDQVKAGQMLAQIDPVQARSDATSVEAQVHALEADQRGADEQTRAAQSDVAAADARAKDAAVQLKRRSDLAAQGIITQSDLDAARAANDVAIAQLSAARAAFDRAKQARTAAERRVAQARALLVRANDVLRKTSVVAPIDGIVSRLRVREGEMVVVGIQNQPGTTLMTISDLGAINAEVKVAEADVLRVSLGQPSTVTLEALPGKKFLGRVVEIGASALPVAGTSAAAREFKVVVRIESPDAGLRPGLTCDAEIITSERTNVLTVPLQSVVLRKGGDGVDRSGVFVVRDGKAQFAPVEAGVIGGLDIEVSGIAEGTQVVIGPYQVLRDLNDGALLKPAAPKKG